ncbi:hypothetical protein [Roseibium marinum]|uniref:Uncharacterized protein n=1 Tax=Roseibium marinum TaxID=281252 RepID=A0A2S3UMH7_9HYPH|nr:hypothetical protein [Roseibium marinum]POF28927.1 hypothetical protein CLV41_111179 [Roseibium marinum]
MTVIVPSCTNFIIRKALSAERGLFFCVFVWVIWSVAANAADIDFTKISSIGFDGRIYSTDGQKSWEVRIYNSEGDRDIEYRYHNCKYVLVPSPERAGEWLQEKYESPHHRNSRKCKSYNNNIMNISSEDNGDLSISVYFKDENKKYIGKLSTHAEFVKGLCPPYPQQCNLWAPSMQELTTALKERPADDAMPEKHAGLQKVPDDGKRRPWMGDWTDCGRPHEFKYDPPQDTGFNYDSLSLVCRKDFSSTKWMLKIESEDFGEGYRFSDAKPGMLIESVAKHNRGYYEVEAILEILASMEPGDITKIYYNQPEKKCSDIGCKVFDSTVKMLKSGHLPSVNLTYSDGNPFGPRLELFANGDFIELEDLLEKDAQNSLANTGGVIWNWLSGMQKDFAVSEIYKTRYARMITNYILVRQLLHGDCGEGMETVKWGTTRWTEYRNGFGHYKGSSEKVTTYEYFDIAAGFEAPLEKVSDLSFEPEEVRLMTDVVQHTGCGDPVRKQIESNMLTFYRAEY